jgi:hypothetical protein
MPVVMEIINQIMDAIVVAVVEEGERVVVLAQMLLE